MCGICGYITDKNISISAKTLEEMCDVMSHRGPDDRGFYIGKNHGRASVGLGHRRLSIIDLSEQAHQPMSNEDGTVWLTFNGEIYNFIELKRALLGKGHKFRSACDSEVILHLYEEYKEKCLDHLNGMFAFAIWDSIDNSLFAARDRMGEKPFFYADCDGVFIFASEMKALFRYPGFKKELDLGSLQEYLAYEYVPAPGSILKGVRKLPAGNFLKWKDGFSRVAEYWGLRLDRSETSLKLSEGEYAGKIVSLLTESIDKRLISDVPLGVFLSGGLDSSIILSLMCRLRDPKKIDTFSIGFADKSFDESGYARRLAGFFKTNHREEILTPDKVLEIIPRATDILDEPLGDASIIPAYLLSGFTRKHIKVAIGGDGGDELFAGYPTFQADKAIGLFSLLPGSLKNGLFKAAQKFIPVSFDNISLDFKIKQFLRGGLYAPLIRHFIWLGSFTPEMQVDIFKDRPLRGANQIYSLVNESSAGCRSKERMNTLLYLYTKFYLQNDLLVKMDTASMAHSLEVRSPFLDLELMNFVETVPHRLKIRGFTTKYILRKAFAGILPEYILRRPKKGFGIPVAKWFRNELKPYLLSVLSGEEMNKGGIFDAKFVHSLMEDHFSGRSDNRKLLWTLVIFQQWFKKNF
ncbi:MAG: asparagine synthase (glutamine-hydrolyzing) [Candidatus Omnitrophota bacterium]|nr:asparagine synthase (glutamine-hydrolyzing) [Candidatus Omnitrophota bacterium]